MAYKLNSKKVAALKTPGRFGDGGGLYLNIAPGGTKSWVLRVTVKGQSERLTIGIGSIETLSLAEARTKASELKAEAKAGRNPRAKRDFRKMTFEEAAREKHASLEQTFRNDKHRAQWISSLENHAFAKIGHRHVADIERDDILRVLSPIWIKVHPTAKRLKQRLRAVFNRAIANKQRASANPVDSVLDELLDNANHKPKHHAALPWAEVPPFMAELAQREAVAALCLRFIILTAARSGEARMATWNEIDLQNRTWTIPEDRMKSEKEHRVPLCDEAMEILKEVAGHDTEILFPTPQNNARSEGKPLSVNAFRPLFKRMDREGLTTHGFRSSFRDWCAEKAHADRQLAEAALAHRVGGVEGAYFRSDLFERRRAFMDAWGRYATGQTGDVVELVRA